MLDLSFLSSATITDVAESKVAHRTGVRKQRTPDGLRIRVFRDGSVYPSTSLVAKFDLEFQPKGSDEQGNGFDIVDTANYPSFQVGKRILIISPVNRKAGKVDLFASTTYNEDGSPKASVLEQGATTYGKSDLLPALKDVYDIEVTDYVDLELVSNPSTGEPWMLPEGKQVTFLPKKVSRGKEKGSLSVTRRESPSFYALVPVSSTEQSGEAESEPTESQADEVDSTEGVNESTQAEMTI